MPFLRRGNAANALERAQAFAASGRTQKALELLARENRREESADRERALVDLLLQSPPSHPAPGRFPAPRAGKRRQRLEVREGLIPEISAAELSAPVLREAIERCGHLIVRGLFDPAHTAPLREAVDAALRARVRAQENADEGTGPWYYASPHFPGKHRSFHQINTEKKYGLTGSIRVIDSPRGTFRALEFLHRYGMKKLVGEYFGEPPVLATRKWVYRLATPREVGTGVGGGWHQDGQFMGPDARALNLWAPLSECGEGTAAPGIAILPRRIDELLEAGTRGANLFWVVGGELVQELARETPVVTPYFGVGDALFFDHYSLHRTGHAQGQTMNRYALESWFYAGSGSLGNDVIGMY